MDRMNSHLRREKGRAFLPKDITLLDFGENLFWFWWAADGSRLLFGTPAEAFAQDVTAPYDLSGSVASGPLPMPPEVERLYAKD